MKRWKKRLLIIVSAVLLGLPALLTGLYAFLSRTNAELVSSGETRKYLLHVPDSYTPGTPVPLVISLHGAYLYPSMQQRLTGWNALADKHGFIVVYPRAAGFPRTWRLAPGPGLNTEVQFFSDLIKKLSGEYSIDRSRIYANGYSNGAAMTFMLSCTLPDQIAAFGMVATPVVPWNWCKDHRPVPMLAFHGTADPYAPYAGGSNFLTTEPLPSMQTWLSEWKARNGCGAGRVDTSLATDASRSEYRDCTHGVTTRLYTLKGSGHIWPGGRKLPEFGTGHYTESINATQEMWTDFQQHPLQTTTDPD